MAIMAGSRLGHYEIIEKPGEANRAFGLTGVALVFIIVPNIESVEQAGLRLRWNIATAQVKPEAPMLPGAGPGTALRPGGIPGKPVAPVVVLVGRVTLGPDPIGFVDPNQLVQFHPKIGTANRMVLVPPVPALPAYHPLRDSLQTVLGVGGDFYFARFLEREEALDRRHQLHSVVGGVRIVPEEFLLDRTEAQDAGPPSGTGISQTRSID